MSRPFPQSLLLIGAGKMGGALLRAWQDAGMRKKSITVVDTLSSMKGVLHSLDEVKRVPECIVLAVKPQSLDTLLPEVRSRFGHAPLYISIAAGKRTSYFEKKLGKQAAVIRVMPNTPALVGKGMSALFANKNTSGIQKKNATALFDAAGKTAWLKNETQMDAATAISGSGPAYVFLFLESLIAAGKKHGLPEAVCKQLAIETLAGSAKLAKLAKEPLSKLRANVTSKGGTTEAALSILMKDDSLPALLDKAVASAVKRAMELA